MMKISKKQKTVTIGQQNQGMPWSQYNLAMLLEPDFDRMLPNLERASSQGHPEALYYLGSFTWTRMLLNGI
jgi:hypothetical protein